MALPKARFNSETQKRKREEAKLHPPKYVGCSKCGLQITTLRKIGEGKYLCPTCYQKDLDATTKNM